MLGYYVKLCVIIYTDDTVPLAEFENNLQNMLNLFQEYCIKWKIKVKIIYLYNVYKNYLTVWLHTGASQEKRKEASLIL